MEPLLFIQVAPQLTSRGWVDPVPDPVLHRKSGSAGNRTRDLCICSQKLWPLDYRGGHSKYIRLEYEFLALLQTGNKIEYLYIPTHKVKSALCLKLWFALFILIVRAEPLVNTSFYLITNQDCWTTCKKFPFVSHLTEVHMTLFLSVTEHFIHYGANN